MSLNGFAATLERGVVEPVEVTASMTGKDAWVEVLYPDGKTARLVTGQTFFWQEADAKQGLYQALTADIDELTTALLNRQRQRDALLRLYQKRSNQAEQKVPK